MVTDLVEHAYMGQARLQMKISTSLTTDRVCLAWLYVFDSFLYCLSLLLNMF